MHLGTGPKSYQLDISQRLSFGTRREVAIKVLLPQNYPWTTSSDRKQYPPYCQDLLFGSRNNIHIGILNFMFPKWSSLWLSCISPPGFFFFSGNCQLCNFILFYFILFYFILLFSHCTARGSGHP